MLSDRILIRHHTVRYIQSNTITTRRHTAHTIKTIKPSCLPENFILRLKLWVWCGGWMVGVGRLFWLLVWFCAVCLVFGWCSQPDQTAHTTHGIYVCWAAYVSLLIIHLDICMDYVSVFACIAWNIRQRLWKKMFMSMRNKTKRKEKKGKNAAKKKTKQSKTPRKKLKKIILGSWLSYGFVRCSLSIHQKLVQSKWSLAQYMDKYVDSYYFTLYIIHTATNCQHHFGKWSECGGDDEHSHCCCYVEWVRELGTRGYGWQYCNTMIPSNLIKHFFRLAHFFPFVFLFFLVVLCVYVCTSKYSSNEATAIQGSCHGVFFFNMQTFVYNIILLVRLTSLLPLFFYWYIFLCVFYDVFGSQMDLLKQAT